MILLALAQAAFVALAALLLVRVSRRTAPRALHLALAAVALQALSMMWAMAMTPARYEPYLYARGGLARTVQVIATSLGPSGVVLLSLGLAAAYLVSGPRRVAAAAAAVLLLAPARAWAAPDVVLLSASSFRLDDAAAIAALGTSVPDAYPGIDHPRVAATFRSLGYDVETIAVPRGERAAGLGVLFLPIIDTPLARVLAPAIERAAHAGDPALVAREAQRALARPHERPLLLDVRFDATDAPYDVPAPFYAKYTDSGYRGRFAYSAGAADALDAADRARIVALYRGAAAAIDDAVADLARHVPPPAVVIFTADHGTTPFESVPLVVRAAPGDAALWPLRLGLTVPSPGHVALVRTPPQPPTGLPEYLVRDDRYALVYRPARTGVTYTLHDLLEDPGRAVDVSDRHPEMRAYLHGELWDHLREEGLLDQEGFAVPPPPPLPFGISWRNEASSDGVVFTDAHATSDESVNELLELLEIAKARGPEDRARAIVVAMPLPHTGPSPAPTPLAIAVPGLAPRTVSARVGTGDVGATLRELLGLVPSSSSRGVSLGPLLRGDAGVEERAIATRTPDGVRTLFWGRRHLVVRGARAALYDLDADPLEQHDLAQHEPAVVEELHARLVAAESGVPIAGSRAALEGRHAAAAVHLRFAGAGAVHRISGTIDVPEAMVEPVGISRDAFKMDAKRIDVAFTTSANESVGLDLRIEPSDAAIHWQLYLDDAPWPARGVFLGCHGLATSRAFAGLESDESRLRATCAEAPALDAQRDLGMLVTRTLVTR